jgi:hypothetical protein
VVDVDAPAVLVGAGDPVDVADGDDGALGVSGLGAAEWRDYYFDPIKKLLEKQ